MPLDRRQNGLMTADEEEADDEDSDSESNLIPLFAEDENEHENEDDDDDTVGAQHAQNDSTETTLDNFRKEWKTELDSRLKEPSVSPPAEFATANEQQLHDAATKLFLEGVDCERRGDMWEAVQRYMGAVRMVPDIESRVYKDRSSSIPQNFSASDLNSLGSNDSHRSRSRSRFGFREVGDLGNALQRRIVERKGFFEPELSDELCPVARLPVELLTVLMRYVVGSELDVRCLEMLSMTSVGFYILARDEELWHAICRHTFGVTELGTLSNWRQMYITYPHVYLHGVYIGKTTYLRHGEASFQDQFYKPWHIIVYYRMLKFFADGTVVMITTSEPPAQMVGFLKSKTPRLSGVLTGHYWIEGQDRIAAQFHRRCEKSVHRPRRVHRLRHQFIPYEIVDQKFDMKLHFGDGKKRRAHCVLQMEEYNYTVTYLDGKVSHNSLDTSDHQAYPPLFFSRVKSYAIPEGWDEMLS